MYVPKKRILQSIKKNQKMTKEFKIVNRDFLFKTKMKFKMYPLHFNLNKMARMILKEMISYALNKKPLIWIIFLIIPCLIKLYDF